MSSDGLDELLARALTCFHAELVGTGWWGREREGIGLFVFGHLLPLVGRPPLLHPTQIGIEVAVPQLSRPGAKAQVNKDLVLWSEPRQTCWDASGRPVVAPRAVLEWKCGARELAGRDLEWLVAFSRLHQGFTGFSVCFRAAGAASAVSAVRCEEGRSHEWLELEGEGD